MAKVEEFFGGLNINKQIIQNYKQWKDNAAHIINLFQNKLYKIKNQIKFQKILQENNVLGTGKIFN